MTSVVKQGAIHYCHFNPPIKSRPVLVLSRTELNTVRENVIVALITRTIRQIPIEVPVGTAEGLPREGVVSLGDIHTVPKSLIGEKKGSFLPRNLRRRLMHLNWFLLCHRSRAFAHRPP